jgi:hypothetical protein
MTEVMKSISDALNMNPLVVSDDKPEDEVVNLPVPLAEEIQELTQEEKDGEEDFAVARANIKSLLEKGVSALDQLLLVASASEQPRAFEIVSTMIKTLTDSNEKLMDLHEKRRQLLPVVPVKEEAAKQNQPSLQANNVFIGTTDDFLTLLEKKRQSVAAERIIDVEVKEVKNGEEESK